MKIGTEKSLNFLLDTSIIIENKRFIFDTYYKSTFSDRFLNFHSNHPFCQKRGIIISMMHKIVRLSHPCFHQKNLIDVIQIFLNNDYPLSLIFSIINNRIK